MPLKEPKFKHNQTFLKLLGFGEHQKIVLSTLGCVRNSDIECEEKKFSSRCSVMMLNVLATSQELKILSMSLLAVIRGISSLRVQLILQSMTAQI